VPWPRAGLHRVRGRRLFEGLAGALRPAERRRCMLLRLRPLQHSVACNTPMCQPCCLVAARASSGRRGGSGPRHMPYPTLPCTRRGPRYIEVDVDVGSSRSAAHVVGLVQGALRSLVIDIAVLLEGHASVRPAPAWPPRPGPMRPVSPRAWIGHAHAGLLATDPCATLTTQQTSLWALEPSSRTAFTRRGCPALVQPSGPFPG